MDFIQQWVTEIIIFLLIAMIVDLLLPQSTMQKYVKFAVGLILVLIFLQPLFQLFKADASQIFQNGLAYNEAQSEEIKNSIEKEKIEIQASQRAYILNQMAVQLKKQAEGELINDYGVTIQDITFTFPNDSEEVNWEDMEGLHVFLKNADDPRGAEVEDVVIDFNQEKPAEELPIDDIKHDLSSLWEISEEQIHLEWEGGDNT
ncbi:stage III sporulation protein AF [Salirhabdus euzebyi]|uniref:Stage III sporulation protein AF n=1 Tax=Salirhabdus euzebyi TaxID=394506 RepID=A0A841Q747_9BACI|nr:stage III sporulation protein AF [Salirhabdus euzebyi]MBB6454228.1 stage III sporulation protein AF [Salirhabdus euzebyi]